MKKIRKTNKNFKGESMKKANENQTKLTSIVVPSNHIAESKTNGTNEVWNSLPIVIDVQGISEQLTQYINKHIPKVGSLCVLAVMTANNEPKKAEKVIRLVRNRLEPMFQTGDFSIKSFILMFDMVRTFIEAYDLTSAHMVVIEAIILKTMEAVKDRDLDFYNAYLEAVSGGCSATGTSAHWFC